MLANGDGRGVYRLANWTWCWVTVTFLSFFHQERKKLTPRQTRMPNHNDEVLPMGYFAGGLVGQRGLADPSLREGTTELERLREFQPTHFQSEWAGIL